MAASRVQSKIDNTNANVTFNSNTTSGNTIVVAVARSTSRIGASEVTDNKSNTFTRRSYASNTSAPANDDVAIFVAENITGGASHQVSYSGGGTIVIVEYSGLNTASYDQQNSATGSSTTPASGNITTTGGNYVYIAAAWSINNGDSWAAGSGYTIFQSETDNNTFERIAVEDKIVAATTSNGNFTVGTTGSWAACLVTLSEPSTYTPKLFTLLGVGK